MNVCVCGMRGESVESSHPLNEVAIHVCWPNVFCDENDMNMFEYYCERAGNIGEHYEPLCDPIRASRSYGTMRVCIRIERNVCLI